MRLALDDVLAMHGIGGGLGSSFGTGADGTFAPAQTIVSGTLTTSTTSFSSSGNVPNTSSGNATGIMAVMLVNQPDSVQIPTIPTANLGTATTYSPAANLSYGTKFTLNQHMTISAFAVAFNGAYSVTAYLVDNNGVTLATINQTTSASGYTVFNLPNPVTIPSGLQYEITVYSSSAYGIKVSPSGTAVVANFNSVIQGTTFTFTAPTQDGGPVIKQFTSINIPAGVTVTVDKRCKGLIMLCQGNVTISGGISMDGLAAIADPTDMVNNPAYVSIDKAQYLYDPTQPQSKQKTIVIGPGGHGGRGGDGGFGASGTGTLTANTGGKGGRGSNGTWWGGGRGGGGGGGSSLNSGFGGLTSSANGGDADYTTIGTPGASQSAASASKDGLAGGAGAGASGGAQSNSTSYTATSGAGGAPLGGGGGGGGGCAVSGTGNNATAQSGSPATGAPGGLILIIAQGNVTINSGAILSSKGTAGGNGGAGAGAGTTTNATVAGAGGGGGGGTGGGVITVLYKGTLLNSGTTTVTGGVGGTGGGTYSATGGYNVYAQPGQNGTNGRDGVVQLVAL